MIIAKAYVRIAGRMYTPGEVLDAELTDSAKQRLLRLEAITETADEAENVTAADAEVEETAATVQTAEQEESPEEITDDDMPLLTADAADVVEVLSSEPKAAPKKRRKTTK